MAKKLKVRTQFVAEVDGSTVVVLPGAVFPAGHPIVEAHRESFDPPLPRGRTAASGTKQR
jgi:hypothetical protein